MSQRGSSFRKFLLWTVVAIVAVEAIWFFGANWALNSEWVIGAINKKPEKLEVLWGGAKTYIPGVIHVEDLSVKGTSKRQQWQVGLERVRVHLALLSLPFKTFRTYDVQGKGLEFTLSKRGKPTVETESEASGEVVDGKPVEGAGPPGEVATATTDETGAAGAADPPQREAETAKKKSKRPWRFGLQNIHIVGAESIGVLGYVLSGQGTIDADMGLELKGGPLSIQRARINLEEATFQVKGQQAASDLTVGIDVSLAPFVPKQVRGMEVLGSLTGRVALQGRTQGAGIVNMFLSKFKGFEIGSSGGALDSDLQFKNGVLIPESHFHLKSSQGWIRLTDLRVETALEVGIVAESTAPDGTKLSVAVQGVELKTEGTEGPLLEGADVTLDATSPGIDFATGIEGLREAFDSIQVDLTNAVVADITRFPLPDFEDFTLDSGTIAVEAHFKATPEAADGSLNVAGTGIDASFGEIGLVGDLEIDINIDSPDPDARLFRVGESVINIDNVTMTKGEKEAKEKDEDWYAHVKILEGEFDTIKPHSMTSDIEIGMRDTRPIISIFAQEKSILRWFKGMLNFKDLEGTAGMKMEGDLTEIQDLDIDSEGLKVKANMKIGEQAAGGIMWVKFHGINVGIDTREGTDVRLKKPLRWYEEQAALWKGDPAPVEAEEN